MQRYPRLINNTKQRRKGEKKKKTKLNGRGNWASANSLCKKKGNSPHQKLHTPHFVLFTVVATRKENDWRRMSG